MTALEAMRSEAISPTVSRHGLSALQRLQLDAQTRQDHVPYTHTPDITRAPKCVAPRAFRTFLAKKTRGGQVRDETAREMDEIRASVRRQIASERRVRRDTEPEVSPGARVTPRV
jgi:hypothetical protein